MISVIIPLYNKEKSISFTINSVLNQSYPYFELIIVNDGSTDNSLEEAQKIEDPRIRIINKPNGGVSSARNRGIKEAKFDFIAFLDGDDSWIDNHLEIILKMISVYPKEKVLSTTFAYFVNNGDFNILNEDKPYIINNYFKEAQKKMLINSSSIVIHVDCFNEIGLFDENLKRGEDLDMWMRLAEKYKIVKSNQITVIYNQNSENRAVKMKYNVEGSILSKIDLKKCHGDKKEYCMYLVKQKIKSLIFHRSYIQAFKMIFKHLFDYYHV